jgi:hypothetical protein
VNCLHHIFFFLFFYIITTTTTTTTIIIIGATGNYKPRPCGEVLVTFPHLRLLI